MTCFPAEPGTWLISMDPDSEPVPIIGWAVSGVNAFPVLPIMADPVSGQAYRLAGTGAVVDPAWGRTFESEEAWRTAASRQAPYEPGTSLFFGTEKRKPPKAAPAASTTSAPAAVANVDGIELLTFGTKAYKSKSYWRFDGGVAPFVFEIAGETPIPTNEDAEKITRAQFFELRKTLTVAAVNPDELLGSGEPDDDDDIDGMV